MPTYEYGDMWSVYPDATDHFLITTNAFVRVDGCLVMGRGIAAQAKERHPELPRLFGNLVAQFKGRPYHVLLGTKSKIGLFQVKRNFYDTADTRLIAESAKRLAGYARVHPDQRFDLNYPGIGNGHLTTSEVEPLIAHLPANVHVWRPAEARPVDQPVTPTPLVANGNGASKTYGYQFTIHQDGETVVVHAHDQPYDVYIGRNPKLLRRNQTAAQFGNPIVLNKPCPVCGETHGTKGSSLTCYKSYLWKRINDDPHFRAELWQLRGKVLGCHCRPEICHGDVIIDWLNKGGPYKNGDGSIHTMQNEERN